jgi:nucleoside-diphosphate-sugar epimerase
LLHLRPRVQVDGPHPNGVHPRGSQTVAPREYNALRAAPVQGVPAHMRRMLRRHTADSISDAHAVLCLLRGKPRQINEKETSVSKQSTACASENLHYFQQRSGRATKKNIFNKNHFQLDLEKDNLNRLGKIKFNYIINASGYVEHNLNNSEKILKNHFLPIRNLFRTVNMNYIEKIIHIGSGNEYGEQKKIINENACCVPKSIYGFAKLMSTRYIENFCKKNKIPYIILRVFLAYGNNQKKK